MSKHVLGGLSPRSVGRPNFGRPSSASFSASCHLVRPGQAAISGRWGRNDAAHLLRNLAQLCSAHIDQNACGGEQPEFLRSQFRNVTPVWPLISASIRRLFSAKSTWNCRCSLASAIRIPRVFAAF